jgi:hypothetical protein
MSGRVLNRQGHEFAETAMRERASVIAVGGPRMTGSQQNKFMHPTGCANPSGVLIAGAVRPARIERRSLEDHPLFRRESGIWVPFTSVTLQDGPHEALKNDRMTVRVGLLNRGFSDRLAALDEVAIRSVKDR